MKRAKDLFKIVISDGNLRRAIYAVNDNHRWHKGHKPNYCTAWVELTIEDRIAELRQIILDGFQPKPPRITVKWDKSAGKYRKICEPAQYPDQYIHHAMIQALEPVMMRGMDYHCCGSIPGKGTHNAARYIEKWVRRDRKHTKYCFSCDIYHFYDSLQPEMVMERMRHLIKDSRMLGLISRVIQGGIHIGYYPSQWFANTVLQPLDMLIRQRGFCAHYVRYMDNMTMFGSNKRHLRQLKNLIFHWLAVHGLQLKGDWQIFPIDKGGKEVRLPDAVGYRFGRDYTIPRKKNLLRMKRGISKIRKRMRKQQIITGKMAASILGSLGQLAYCDNCNLYKMLFRGEKFIRHMKEIIRKQIRKDEMTWSMFLEQVAMQKHCV